MAEHTSGPMSYLEPIKPSSQEIKNAISQLRQVFPNEDINMRLVNWLWRYVQYNVPSNALQQVNYNCSQGLIELGKQLSADTKSDHSAIRTKKNAMMVSEKDIAWLQNEENQLRLMNWIHQKEFDTCLSKLWIFDGAPRANNIEGIITNIDCQFLAIEEKVRLLQLVNTQWEIAKSSDNIFKWFKNDDTQSKINTAYNWICENSGLFKQKSQIPVSLSHPSSHQFNSIEDLQIYFDSSALKDSDKILCIDRIKRRFNQEKYKESIKDKKQCNYVLKNETISTLEKISKITGKNRTEIIENLINEAYKKILSDAQK